MPQTSISKWIGGRSQSSSLPILPSERPHALTPSPSHESLPVSSTPSASSLFRLLPPELRRLILIEAFGNRTVHMDLIYDYPLMPLAKRRRDPKLSEKHGHISPRLGLNNKWHYSRRWWWHSTVCHRSVPSLFGHPRGGQPCDDECHLGTAWYCAVSGPCFIGAMGWLLSCRQSYVEGIHVLYSTNTIHLANTLMIRNLPRLLLRQRLSSITSVEMRWELHPFRDEKRGDIPDTGLSAFDSLVEITPKLFPHLKRLHISLQGDMRGPKSGDSESLVMRPLDDMVRKLDPRLQECIIALPTSLYSGQKRAESADVASNHSVRGERDRIWRELSTTAIADERTASQLQGYWLYHGKKDVVSSWCDTLGS